MSLSLTSEREPGEVAAPGKTIGILDIAWGVAIGNLLAGGIGFILYFAYRAMFPNQ